MATIVVGIDGSPASAKALRWAAEEARLRGATVRAVYAWSSVREAAAASPGCCWVRSAPSAPSTPRARL